MKKIFLLILPCLLPAHADGLLAVDNPAKNGQTRSVYANVAAFEANDQVAMQQYGGDWAGDYTPRTGTNLGVLFARAEAGVQWSGYRLGAIYRAEALVQANRDTSDLVQQYHADSGSTVGRGYSLDYQLTGFEADGIRLSKRFATDINNTWQLDWGLGVSYLHGKRIKLKTVTGQLVTLNTKDFDALANVSDADSLMNTIDKGSFNAPYGRQASASGSGHAVDVGFVLHHASGASLELAVSDLLGRIDWQDLPNNVAVYRSGELHKYYDANGYINYYPAATRTSSYQAMSQTLDPKWWLAATYPLGKFEVKGAASLTQGEWFPQLGMGYHLAPQWQIRTDVDLRFQTLSLSLEHTWFHISLRMDNPNADAAKAYGLTGGVSVAF